MVALMMSLAGHPFFLQVKEANASVLEAYAGKSAFAHHGERVVQGQRLMQPASDLFLGWATGPKGRHFYLRQLRDVKLSPLVETYDAEMLSIYAKACGWVLARAHAKAGDPWTISGYLGKQDEFDEAMGKFALAYADQAERDHAALAAAVRAGIIDVQPRALRRYCGGTPGGAVDTTRCTPRPGQRNCRAERHDGLSAEAKAVALGRRQTQPGTGSRCARTVSAVCRAARVRRANWDRLCLIASDRRSFSDLPRIPTT